MTGYFSRLPDDWTRLKPIFREPDSVEALESFNHILYRPSETMIRSLMEAFARALQTQSSLNGPESLLDNPLFILILTKRLIIHVDHSATAQPSKAQLESTFQEIFLPAFVNIRFLYPAHQPQSDCLSQQFIVCLTRLSTRLLRSYSSKIDPLDQLLLSVNGLINLEPPQLYPAFDHLSAIKEILISIQKSNSVDSMFLFRQIIKKHFEKLFLTYNHLIMISTMISSQLMDPDDALRMSREKEYKAVNKSINVLLKIFKMMIEPLDDPPVLTEITKKFLVDFQSSLDTEMRLIDTREDPSSHAGNFSPHISRYGDILLRVQKLQPSLISEECLTVYVKILEYVSSQLNGPVASEKMIRFYPLLLQAFRMLNNALNPYNSYSSEASDGISSHNNPLENLGNDEISRLHSIVQPFIHLKFSPMGYFDDGFLQAAYDDDGSEEDTEEEMEIEEMSDGNDSEREDELAMPRTTKGFTTSSISRNLVSILSRPLESSRKKTTPPTICIPVILSGTSIRKRDRPK
ncbi:hypothetical protein PCASD_14029 [Puccinia coronata f. sp. avenae]|uniref:Exportin-1 C-terminal domain-containing protein n=1 Tax=Puccinia coronata f. sp. avenae TaxID=200324 RepID=A0A2N5TAP2_9BASI|nr:hypothetical protein PCASD_14029 [Puccinia coronata f. sp. avenae]